MNWRTVLDSFFSAFNQFRTISFIDIIDILIVAYIIYRIMKLLKDTSAERLIKRVSSSLSALCCWRACCI